MAIKGDKTKQPKGCKTELYSNNPCQNLKETGGGMRGERYRCTICGESFYLDYEEMR